MRIIGSQEELKVLVGQKVASSSWVDITQQRVDQFAQATGDCQWIHLDVERSRRESSFGTTVAHGFLTLSLLPMFMEESIAMTGVKMGLNYGLNKVRFPAPVPVGSRLRAHLTLLAVDDIEGGVQASWEVVMERQGSEKPVCVVEVLVRQYY
ncbi:MAG: MaoC family dehydratase [Glaciimonas sp.]|nr:MaoC family dehydratase [Glaciimonas sp.]